MQSRQPSFKSRSEQSAEVKLSDGRSKGSVARLLLPVPLLRKLTVFACRLQCLGLWQARMSFTEGQTIRGIPSDNTLCCDQDGSNAWIADPPLHRAIRPPRLPLGSLTKSVQWEAR